MLVRGAASAARTDAKDVRLHDGVAPGKQFHAHTRGGFEDFPLGGSYELWILSRRLEKRKNIRAIEAGDAAKGGDGRAHLAAFESAEEAHGNPGGPGDLRKGEAAARSQSAEAL